MYGYKFSFCYKNHKIWFVCPCIELATCTASGDMVGLITMLIDLHTDIFTNDRNQTLMLITGGLRWVNVANPNWPLGCIQHLKYPDHSDPWHISVIFVKIFRYDLYYHYRHHVPSRHLRGESGGVALTDRG